MESVEKDIDRIKNIISVTCNSGRWPANGWVEFVDTCGEEEEVGESKGISPAFRLLAVLGESELLKAALVKRS